MIKERIFCDTADRNVIHDEITLVDHALTRPWTVTKDYRRASLPRPLWRETGCAENNVGHDGAFIGSSAFALRVGEQSFIEIRAFYLITMGVFLVKSLREVELDAFAGFV